MTTLQNFLFTIITNVIAFCKRKINFLSKYCVEKINIKYKFSDNAEIFKKSPCFTGEREKRQALLVALA